MKPTSAQCKAVVRIGMTIVASILLYLLPGAAQTGSSPVPEKGPNTPRKGQDVTLSEAAARRNENVPVNLIDSEAIKEANVRLGENATLVSRPPAEENTYASEHGRPTGENSTSAVRFVEGFHAELYESLQNSVLNARTFFQVGPVKPSRQNSYGGRWTFGRLGAGIVSGAFSQRKVRGMVNGNVQVPLLSERVPLTADPALRAVVSRILAAFPAELPNRTDLYPRPSGSRFRQNPSVPGRN